jgi:hypothetical protein
MRGGEGVCVYVYVVCVLCVNDLGEKRTHQHYKIIKNMNNENKNNLRVVSNKVPTKFSIFSASNTFFTIVGLRERKYLPLFTVFKVLEGGRKKEEKGGGKKKKKKKKKKKTTSRHNRKR